MPFPILYLWDLDTDGMVGILRDGEDTTTLYFIIKVVCT